MLSSHCIVADLKVYCTENGLPVSLKSGRLHSELIVVIVNMMNCHKKSHETYAFFL